MRRTWGQRVALTIADQALASSSNFLANLLYLRLMSPEQFGVYALSFSVFLFLLGFYNALVLEPMTIYGPSMDSGSLATYLRSLMPVHLLLSTIMAVPAACFALLIVPAGGGHGIAAMAALLPVLLASSFSRRACYLRGSTRLAALSSLAALVTTLLTILLLYEVGLLNSLAAFVPAATASVVASAVSWRGLGLNTAGTGGRALLSSSVHSFRLHWRLGKWVSLQNLLTLGSAYAQILVATAAAGVATAGFLQALVLTTQPIQQIMIAVGSYLILPLMSREFAAGRIGRFVQIYRYIVAAFVVLAVLQFAALTLLRAPLAHFLFNGRDEWAWMIVVYGSTPILIAIGTGAGISLRAAKQGYYYPIVTGAQAVAGVATAASLTYHFGTGGAVVSSFITYAVWALTAHLLYRAWLRRTLYPSA